MEEQIDEKSKEVEDSSYNEVNPAAWIFTIILASTALLLIYIDRAYYQFL